MRLWSNFRLASRSSLVAGFALLVACQSGATVPVQNPSLRQSSLGSSTKIPCGGYTFKVLPASATIKRRHKQELRSFIIYYHGGGKWGCLPEGIPVNAAWQTSGGHLSSTYGQHVRFWSGRTGDYTIDATTVYQSKTWEASATVTVQD